MKLPSEYTRNRRGSSPAICPPTMKVPLGSMLLDFRYASSRARTSRIASPMRCATSYIELAFSMPGSSGACFARCCSRFRAFWVVDRLPADRVTITRSPALANTRILLVPRTSSTPALVRESEAKTRPSSSLMATQYVIVAIVVRIGVVGGAYSAPAGPPAGQRNRHCWVCICTIGADGTSTAVMNWRWISAPSRTSRSMVSCNHASSPPWMISSMSA